MDHSQQSNLLILLDQRPALKGESMDFIVREFLEGRFSRDQLTSFSQHLDVASTTVAHLGQDKQVVGGLTDQLYDEAIDLALEKSTGGIPHAADRR